MTYIWQRPDWPDLKYDLSETEGVLLSFAEATGHITGTLKAMPDSVTIETLIDTMVAEAIKTSEIEGEYLSRQDVVSSIRNNLGISRVPEPVKDKKAKGAGELMVNARNTYAEPLTAQKLFEWHKMLLEDNKAIKTGAWRTCTEPMQVISGAIGKEKVHFEAPPSERVPFEMERYVQWFNDTAPGGSREISKAPVRSAIAHLYFETIHPFEDGNGRIGRVLAEKALSQTLGRPVMLSLSRSIEAKRKDYYNALEAAQKSTKITAWIRYFIKIILDAQIEARELLDFTLTKTTFYDRYKNQLNERQKKALNKMLDAGPEGFEGGMSAKKYMSIAKTSKATATRDLQNLAEIGALKPGGGGRSTSYTLNL